MNFRLDQTNFAQLGEYVKHRLYDPSVYFRNFEHDWSQETTSVAKRVALIALPFLSLYKPFGTTISITTGSIRSITNITETVKSASNKDALGTLRHLNQTALAIIAVATTVFHFQTGLLITSFADVATSFTDIAIHLNEKDYPKALEALMQASASALYLSFMLSGTLEVMLASILLQASINLYQATQELKKERYPETLAKMVMGILCFNRAYDQFQLIQKKNAFLQLEKFANLVEKIKKGREAAHLINSPLHEEKENVVMMDANGKEYDFGTHFHGIGKGLVKGMNLQFRTTHVDGKNMKDIDFKVNHVFRNKLQALVEGMNSFTPEETRDFLALTQSHAKGIKIERIPFNFCEETNKVIGEAYKVTLKGLGNVYIGASNDMAPIYDTLRVQIDEDKTIYELHEMLSFFNLEDAIQQSSVDDVERLKIGHLFRIFFPSEATKLERQVKFFTLPLTELKAEIIRQVPEMKQTMESFLNKMETTEILPGRLRYALPDISKMAHELGARALISSITGSHSYKESCDRVASILKMGMLSTEIRYRNGINQEGLSSYSDFQSGGSDAIFTQLLTAKNFDQKMDLQNLSYGGNIRVLFSIDALDSGTYQFHTDNFGSRQLDGSFETPYTSRPSIFDFVKDEQDYFHSSNEVMIKERISPAFIQKLIVPNKEIANYQLKVLRENGLVKKINNIETIFDIPVSKFIVITNTLSNKLLL